ncbi:MAG: hypothetical protein AAGG06_15135 [Pseudomonadota bacterium]
MTEGRPAQPVAICDVLATVDQQNGLVQDFVENAINSALKATGFDLEGTIDRLKEKLRAPFRELADILDQVDARLDEVLEKIGEALQSVQDFFGELGELLGGIPGAVFESQTFGNDASEEIFGTTKVVLEDGRAGLTDVVEGALFGGGSRDLMDGRGGDDFIFGGTGSDRIIGGEGSDELYGGADADQYALNAEFGQDFVSDGSGGELFTFSGDVNLDFYRVDGNDLKISVEGTDNSVTVEGFYDAGRYQGATFDVGGEEVAPHSFSLTRHRTGSIPHPEPWPAARSGPRLGGDCPRRPGWRARCPRWVQR